MRKLAGPALAGVLVMAAARSSDAQDRLTVDQAVQAALTHNASLRAATAGVAEGEARVAEARSGWFPRVSVAETWQRGDQPVFVFSSLLAARRFGAANFAVDALNQPEPVGFFRTSIGIDQMLFDGGEQRAAVDRARTERDIAQFSLDETRARLAVSTTEIYGRALAAESSRRAAEAALEAARHDRARARDRRDAGMATDADVLALDAYVASLEQRRVRHDGDAAIARADLNRLMGAPIDRAYLTVEPPVATTDGSTSLDVAALLAEADANRPEMHRASAAAKLARTERRRAGAPLMPRIAAQARVEMSGTGAADRASSWIVGAEARWSLSLGGAERARLKAAAAAGARAAAEADEARAAVHVDVVTALRRRESAVARLAAGRAAVVQARETERIVRDRFEAGLASVTDLLRASTAVLDADAERTAATVDALVGDAQLKHALGRRP